MKRYMDTAVSAVQKAAPILRDLFTHAKVSFKGINNTVTNADLESEKAIVTCIKSDFPNHTILGEEYTQATPVNSENLWIIDPLDGTNNYANSIPHYGISIAFAQKGIIKMGVIYDPCREEMFTAELGRGAYCNQKLITVSQKKAIQDTIIATGFYYDRGVIMEHTLHAIHTLFKNNIRGIRRMGSATLDLAWTACGRFDAYFEYSLSPWDFAAGMLLVQEAGGCCYNNFGHQMDINSHGIIAVSDNLQKQILPLIQQDK